jgi:hypothetical protein
MPFVNKQEFLNRPFSIWVNGPEKSGKTRLAMGFPKVLAATFDTTGLDCLSEPENIHLLDNLVFHAAMNGKPLRQVFQFSEEPGEQGIYPVVALAKQLALEGKVKTFLLDGFTYLASLKWAQICEDNGVNPTEKEKMNRRDVDQRSWYDALGSYLDHLMLQNVFPLTSAPYNLNVVVTCHIQRESDNTIKGMQGSRNTELAAQAKRAVNLDSDLSPQVIGSFRQRIGGMPSAHIYLEHKLIEKDGKEALDYIAYCRMTRSPSLDTVIKAGNRYGLGTLRLTGGSFYNTLLKKIKDSRNAAQSESGSNTKPPASSTSSTSPTKVTSTTKGA